MADPAVQKMEGTHTLDQAVLLASTGLFETPSHRGREEVGALTCVGGLSLFLRTVLTLQRAGIKELLVLAGDEEHDLRESIRNDPRVTLLLRWMPLREFPLEECRTWEVLGARVQGPCLVVGGRTLLSLQLVERLMELAREGKPVLVGSRRLEQEQDGLSVNPRVTVRGNCAVGHSERRGDGEDGREEPDGLAADVLVLPPGLLGQAGKGEKLEHSLPLRLLVEQAVTEGKVRILPASPASTHWYRKVSNPAEVKLAEQALLQSLTGEFEGFVDRYFNRPVSAPFTRLFIKLGLSPNVVTMISILIGLLGALSFAGGTYTTGIMGALLFQLSAIVDCSDGHVARLTFSESEFGARLDLVGDNVVHMALFGGIAWGLYLQQRPGEESWVPLVLGVLAILGNGLSLWIVTRAKKLKSRPQSNDSKLAARSNFILKNLASRDFSVVVLILALAQRLDWFLWLTAIGSHVFWMVAAWMLRPSVIPRA